MPTPKLNDEILTAAIEGFEAQKRRLDEKIAELRQMQGGAQPEPKASEPVKKGRKKMSAAGRARIAEAQRKRWADSKKQPGASSPAASKSAKPKRKLSAAGRKRIIEATKKRWAAVRAAEAAKG